MPKPKITISGYASGIKERTTRTGISMLQFSIPIDAWSSTKKDGYKDAYSGTGFTATSWHRLTLFGEKADNAKTWLHNRSFVTCDVSPFGHAEDGTMTPAIWENKASYEWTVLSISQGDVVPQIDMPDYQEPNYVQENGPPPGFVEEEEIPF